MGKPRLVGFDDIFVFSVVERKVFGILFVEVLRSADGCSTGDWSEGWRREMLVFLAHVLQEK